MAALPNELGETVISGIINANITSSKAEIPTNDSVVNQLADFDTDTEFDDANFFHEAESHCKTILWTPIHSGTNVRTWDLLVLVPNLVFLIVLVAGMRSARQKLRSTNSPIFGAFYSLVVTNTIVSVFRCLVSMAFSTYPALHTSSTVATNADKLLWIILRFFLLATECSVVVFGVASGHLDSKRSIRRVVLISACISLAFSTIQCVLEFHNELDLTFYVESGRLKLFGHGGSLFWMVSSLVFAAFYGGLVMLPILPCKKFLSLPNKRTFYYYVGFMAIMNGLQWVGSLELMCGLSYGLCLVNLTTYVYFTLVTPLIYHIFLNPFFRADQQAPAFSYKAQVDEFEEELMNSNSLQFALGTHADINPTPIIINGGYQRLQNDGKQDQVVGSAYPADP